MIEPVPHSQPIYQSITERMSLLWVNWLNSLRIKLVPYIGATDNLNLATYHIIMKDKINGNTYKLTIENGATKVTLL